jgi:hypothetical protein
MVEMVERIRAGLGKRVVLCGVISTHLHISAD